MISFRKIADGLYALYKGGERVTPLPLTRQELDSEIMSLPLSESEMKHIEAFYEVSDERASQSV